MVPSLQCRNCPAHLGIKDLRLSSAAESLLHLSPRELRGFPGPLAGLMGVAARGRPFEGAPHDALADAGDTKEVVGHAELPHPRLDRCTSRARAVGGDVLRLRGNPEGAEVDVPESRDLAGADPPEHDVVGEVRERMT